MQGDLKMKNTINHALIGLVVAGFVSTANADSHVRSAYEAAPHMGCNTVKTVASWLFNGRYTQLSVGIGADGKKYETWVNSDNAGITWSFDTDRNSDHVQRICVTSVYKDSLVNDKVLAALTKNPVNP